MAKNFYRTILYKWRGWRTQVTCDIPDKCILCVAPHTSNWDFILGEFFIRGEGKSVNFLMKKDWFFWPLGPIFRRMGGIPVYRDKRTHLSEQLAEQAKAAKEFRLAVTPEGTRSKTEKWKRGFYYIAQNAGLPILLFGIDYADKLIVCTKQIVPSGDVERDMQEIMDYYKDFRGKHPDQFAVESGKAAAQTE